MTTTTVAPVRTQRVHRAAPPSALPDVAAWRQEQIASGARPSWLRDAPDPAVVAWLNFEAPALLRPGARVLVAGCGHGFDVAELLERGYDAIGVDTSPDALEAARSHVRGEASRFVQADCFDLPPRLRRRFDLTIDPSMLCLAPPAAREEAAAALAESLCPHGALLVICEGADPAEGAGGVTADGLVELLAGCGMTPTRDVDDFIDDSGDGPPVRRLRAAFRHA